MISAVGWSHLWTSIPTFGHAGLLTRLCQKGRCTPFPRRRLVALSPAPAGAQSGRIVGVVADTTAAVLPGVTVTLYGGPGEPRVSLTDGAGRFLFAGLPPGAYRLGAELSGFATEIVDGIVVATGSVEVPVITLPLAGLSDRLVVTATRTEEPLRDVPMSISAFSGADIEQRDLENGAELADGHPVVLIVDGLHTDPLIGSFSGMTTARESKSLARQADDENTPSSRVHGGRSSGGGATVPGDGVHEPRLADGGGPVRALGRGVRRPR